MLTKVTVEAALNAELDDHLGYSRHEQSNKDNYRNGYSSKIIRTIYTTNAIELLNSVIRKMIKKGSYFRMMIQLKSYLFSHEQASKKWTMPIRNWKTALNRFMIEFEDRLKGVI